MRANAQSVLQPGEPIQAVFGAQSTSPYWVFLSYWILIFANSYRVVVVTPQRIMVCRSGRFTTATIKEVIRELPRSTKIGPASGLWYKTEALGERLYIHKRFHKDVEAADASAA